MDTFHQIEEYLAAVENRKGDQIQHGEIETDEAGKLEGLYKTHTDKLTTLGDNADDAR